MKLSGKPLAVERVVQFVLDGSITRVENIDPCMSILQYLREQLYLTGTKEGCAEGDCGACTVVVGELLNGRVSLKAVNACIQFVPMLHGKVLFTVESLKSEQGQVLHPVQQAMLDQHGSQCGFCTSGFIMSLFALFKTVVQPDRQQINDALSGNLCRCTGYRPIIDAALSLQNRQNTDSTNWLSLPAQDGISPIDAYEQSIIKQLKKIKPSHRLQLNHHTTNYYAPVELQDFSALYSEKPEAVIVAGNTDVGLWVNKQLREIPEILSLSMVDELNTIDVTDAVITIGAAVSLTEAFQALQPHFPQLQDLFRRFASKPVCNAGTLVGNVANGSPIGDSMPVLLTLQAELLLRQGEATRDLPINEFYLGYQQKDLRPGEFIEAIRIPLNVKRYRLASYKVSKRYDQDISAVCGAFLMSLDETGKIDHIKIAYGGMAAIPARARHTEKLLAGKLWNESTLEEARQMLLQDFSPLTDVRGTARYRLKIAQNLLTRFFMEYGTESSEAMTQLQDLPLEGLS